MPITDEDAALQVVAALEAPSEQQQRALHAVNAILGNGEPFVDVHELFAHYDVLYFRGLLVPRVEVLWSPRLTLPNSCAGICELSKDPATATFTRIRLKLSTPLLQYRPRSDTVHTLLHEAVHAYFFVTSSWTHSRGDDGTGHGAGFQLLADAINDHGGYDITIYHSFHDEVDSYRTHVWQCDGPCKDRPPFFGQVKRSMNRPPGRSDYWWHQHETDCGGSYTKVHEPKLTKKQLDAMSRKERAGRQKNKLDNWVKADKKPIKVADAIVPDDPPELSTEGSAGPTNRAKLKRKAAMVGGDMGQPNSRRRGTVDNRDGSVLASTALIQCPICTDRIADVQINEHLDVVHPP